MPKTVNKNLFALGQIALTTPYGNKVAAYGAERTLCDMLRRTANPDKQRLNPAFRSYLSSSGRDIVKLQDFAKALGVFKKVRSYLEVLL